VEFFFVHRIPLICLKFGVAMKNFSSGRFVKRAPIFQKVFYVDRYCQNGENGAMAITTEKDRSAWTD
jgi:hypothetical protein